MTIEFHTPYGKVSEKLVNSIRNDMLELSHINKKISRAEVILKEEQTVFKGENKVCEIRLSVFGDNLFIRSRTDNFESSAKEAIKDLKRMVRQQAKEQKEVPDQMLSTVKV